MGNNSQLMMKPKVDELVAMKIRASLKGAYPIRKLQNKANQILKNSGILMQDSW